MPTDDRMAQERPQESTAPEGAFRSEIVVEGELGCLLVYSDRRHVEYINTILSSLESVLRRRGFKPQRLGQEIRSGEDYLEKLTDLIQMSVLGVVVLDGFRPNVLFEFGFLKGSGKPTIVLMCKEACVSVRTLYASCGQSGLTESAFERRLRDPRLDLSRHFSDFGGKHVSRMDWGAKETEPSHPSVVLAQELDKLEDRILEEAGQVVGRDMPPADLAPLLTPLLNVVKQYYMDPSQLDLKDLRMAHEQLLESAASHGVELPYDVYTIMGGAYLSRATAAPQDASQAVACLESALHVYTELARAALRGQGPRINADNQRRIGDICWRLAQYRDRRENCKRAVTGYEEALRVYTLEDLPMDYGLTHISLGVAYATLAEVQETGENCRRAIEALEEALRVYNIEDFPMEYALTHINLGVAYTTLADIEEQGENCRRAIEALEEARRVYTLEDFPMQYAMTENNLGNAYSSLAEVEEKAENCRKAIEACEEALRVCTLEEFSMQYGTTQNNLGNAYRTLAEVEEKSENCRRAIEAYEEALRVHTLEDFPMQYGTTQNNLGNAYGMLAEVEEKAENCRKAIEAYEEALRVRTLEDFPMDYAMTQNNLGNAYTTLAEVEKEGENFWKAIAAYQEAFRVCTDEKLPELRTLVSCNLVRTLGRM
jgi:tetratricopeptide (TPR) repeat protein